MEVEKRNSYIHVPYSPALYRGYVMTCEGPVNFHIHIHDWPKSVESIYTQAKKYIYRYISEEYPGKVLAGMVYNCHLKGVELAKGSYSTREAGIWMKKQLDQSVGWFLVSLSDIDVYGRILVTLYSPGTSRSINDKIIEYRSKSGTPIALPYTRPCKERIVYIPEKVPTYYFCDMSEQKGK